MKAIIITNLFLLCTSVKGTALRGGTTTTQQQRSLARLPVMSIDNLEGYMNGRMHDLGGGCGLDGELHYSCRGNDGITAFQPDGVGATAITSPSYFHVCRTGGCVTVDFKGVGEFAERGVPSRCYLFGSGNCQTCAPSDNKIGVLSDEMTLGKCIEVFDLIKTYMPFAAAKSAMNSEFDKGDCHSYEDGGLGLACQDKWRKGYIRLVDPNSDKIDLIVWSDGIQTAIKYDETGMKPDHCYFLEGRTDDCSICLPDNGFIGVKNGDQCEKLF